MSYDIDWSEKLRVKHARVLTATAKGGSSMNLITHQIVVEALKHRGVREHGKNDGPEIRAWQARVFRAPPAPWCAAFAWCMLDDSCAAIGRPNPIPGTAGAWRLIERGKQLHAWTREPGAGFIFGIDHGRGHAGAHLGHCGIVVEVDGDQLVTIEGNTDGSGTREGDGVYQRTRAVAECTLGFLDPSRLFG